MSDSSNSPAAPVPDPARVPYLVVNPKSANGQTGRRWAELEAIARASFGEVQVGHTTGPLHAIELSRSALQRGHRLILAVGGDGTLNEVVNGFFREDGSPVAPDAAVGILPQGTGGDFRRTAGVPGNWSEAVRHVHEAPVRRIDLGRVRFRAHDGSEAVRYFINVASFGISGNVDEAVNRASKRFGGKLSFKLGSVRALVGWTDCRVRIHADDQPPEDLSVSVVALGNGQFFGAGMRVAPEAKLDDGTFHATIWQGFGFRTFAFKQAGIYSGEHAKWKNTRCFPVRRLSAESDERVLLDIDGEQPGTLPATFELLRGAVGLKA